MVRTEASLCPDGAPALASHRQTCLRSCVVEVGTLAWLGLRCAVRSQPRRGSVGGRGACDRIEAMLCHRARVSAGFRVRGMNSCGDFGALAPCRGHLLPPRFWRLGRAAQMVSRARRSRFIRMRPFMKALELVLGAGLLGGLGWAAFLLQLALGWTSRGALHRVGKLSRRRSRCH